MIVIGVDAHKRSHTMVAVDAGGRRLGEKTVEATTAGHLAALRWARAEHGAELLWAVEDSRAMTARLERDLINAGQKVIRVPTQMMARTRRTARTWGKSDPIDALAVARAALREPDLPIARHDRCSREVKLLLDRRDDLLKHRTAATQRLLWRLHELDPAYRIPAGGLRWRTQQNALAAWLAEKPGLLAQLARDELADIIRLTPAINAIERELEARIRTAAPALLELYGCGALTAARIIGETADIARFKSEAAYARYAGLAPIPDWSGATRGRVRSHRGGNRQLNAALHQIAMIQIKSGAPAERYYRQRRAVRDSHGYAISGVKRRIATTVFTRLRAARANPPLAALLADLAHRNEQWASALPAAPPPRRSAWPAHRTVPAPTPAMRKLAQIADDWAAALAGPQPKRDINF